MLSRVASNLFWMGRYIERAENISGILGANLKFLLDSETYEATNESQTWVPILESLGVDELFQEKAKEHPELTPFEFLTSSSLNPDSICNCIDQARENARMIQDQISEKMWRHINSIYLYKKQVMEEGSLNWKAQEFFERITSFSFLFQGLTDATLTRGEGHAFYQLGQYLERADKITRILDAPHYGTALEGQNPWSEVLNASGGRGAYISEHGVTVEEKKVTNFLLFSEDFPRSIRFTLDRVTQLLASISQSKLKRRYSNEAERIAGAALASLDFEGQEKLEELGLHDYLDELQIRLNKIGQLIFELYFLIAVDLEKTPIVQPRLTQTQTQSSS